jgi:hypothetical protein
MMMDHLLVVALPHARLQFPVFSCSWKMECRVLPATMRWQRSTEQFYSPWFCQIYFAKDT